LLLTPEKKKTQKNLASCYPYLSTRGMLAGNAYFFETKKKHFRKKIKTQAHREHVILLKKQTTTGFECCYNFKMWSEKKIKSFLIFFLCVSK